MKGTLYYDQGTRKWVVEYNDDGRVMIIDVRPGRIDDLRSVGVELKNEDIVEFQLEDIQEFPYRWAVPIVDLENKTIPGPEPKKKMVKKTRVTLWLSGFYQDEVEIVCTGYDASSTGAGYWYFYDRDKNEKRVNLGSYPISRTIIHSVEEIEVEI